VLLPNTYDSSATSRSCSAVFITIMFAAAAAEQDHSPRGAAAAAVLRACAAVQPGCSQLLCLLLLLVVLLQNHPPRGAAAAAALRAGAAVQPCCEHCQPAANRRRPWGVGRCGRDGQVSNLDMLGIRITLVSGTCARFKICYTQSCGICFLMMPSYFCCCYCCPLLQC
jgi:hypothetical protein